MALKTPEEWFIEVWDETTEQFAVEYLVEGVRAEFAREAAAKLQRECDASTRNATKDKRHNLATLAYAHALRIVESLARDMSAEPTRAPDVLEKAPKADTSPEQPKRSKGWWMKMADLEGDSAVGAGKPDPQPPLDCYMREAHRLECDRGSRCPIVMAQPLSPAKQLAQCCDLASRGHRDGCWGKQQAPAACKHERKHSGTQNLYMQCSDCGEIFR